MDDERTQQALDDLAELFLTGTQPVVRRDDDASRPVRLRPKPTTQTSADPDPAPHSHAGPTTTNLDPDGVPDPDVAPDPDPRTRRPASPVPQLRLTDHEPAPHAAVLDAPPPASAPKPRAERREAAGSAVLPDPGPTPAPRDPAPARPVLEAVLLGNLPGFAQAWLTQYAQLLAQRDGPVLLLTVDADTPGGIIEAELVEPAVRDVLRDVELDLDADAPSDAFDAPPLRLPPDKQRRVSWLLHDLLRDPHAPITTVLIHTDNAPSEIERLLDIGTWTLLTGADETALHAAERSLCALAEAHPDAPGASVGVFVMGSPADRATQAADALTDACLEHFDAPLEALGHLQKQRPAAVRTLGNFPGLDAQWNDLLDALEALPAEALAVSTHAAASKTLQNTGDSHPAVSQPSSDTDTLARAEQPRELVGAAESQPRDVETETPADTEPPADVFAEAEPVVVLPEPVPPPRPRSKPKAHVFRPDPPAPPDGPANGTNGHASNGSTNGHRAATGHIESGAEAATEVAPRDAATVSRPDLPTLLTTARPHLGLRRLDARCPDHPGIDLAVDETGGLHLLARLRDGDHARAALLELRDTRRWAVRHRDLLALAVAALPDSLETSDAAAFTSEAEPATHLFTDHPEQVIPLVAAIDPGVQLHLLQHLPLAAGPSWLATPLQA